MPLFRRVFFCVRSPWVLFCGSFCQSSRIETSHNPLPSSVQVQTEEEAKMIEKKCEEKSFDKKRSKEWFLSVQSTVVVFIIFFFFSPRDLRFVVLIEVHFWCLLKAIESRELNLLTTIVDLGGTHRFTNCRSSRPSCSVALPFDLSWKVHQILNIENDFFPSFFFFFRCNGALIFALCDGRWNRQKCYV